MTRITIVSGGQTGVDRGAMDAAIKLGLDYGGWAPKGYRAEDGTIPAIYASRMRESTSPEYGMRTRLNVQDSDATLILSYAASPEAAGGGTAHTAKVCGRQGKQCVHLRLPRPGSRDKHPDEVKDGVLKWLRLWKVQTLNGAGPRESKARGIQRAAAECLAWILADIAADEVSDVTHQMETVDRFIRSLANPPAPGDPTA